ncbi:taurine catabolism dioxygenase TauD, TfdA family-domain-containing protein [Mycena rosella]|uniref:Taurine catabolism dioxygenase TauD, TfdA family-domain-containing protein n=1 Tax=Mycena rosella TaxID=1033263 RepID=A0AAD7D664_MYCRO|nr:taurine catabolism dioxygenase TauD, TfdA family-domain-containing protein [Mycena rosella]
MAIELAPVPLPPTADSSKLADFGWEVKGVDPRSLTDAQLKEIQDALYTYDLLLFRNANVTPEQQYALKKAFDPKSENYGHGNNATENTPKSILHPHLKTIPRVPQAKLQHPSHRRFHKTVVSAEDEAAGATRFYRWHMDAALYDLSPPRVTTLYGLQVPKGPRQTCRYDDGSGDELPVPLGTTAFVSGKTMFGILPRELKSVAVRTKVKYAPHPYVWMTPARANSTGLGLESEGREVPLSELPPWEEARRKLYPVLWRNPHTGELSFQVHPCGAAELLIEPLPEGAARDGAPFPDGAHLTDLPAASDLLYTMQRPAIAPSLVYPHDWQENDLVLFHNAPSCIVLWAHSLQRRSGFIIRRINNFNPQRLHSSDFMNVPSMARIHLRLPRQLQDEVTPSSYFDFRHAHPTYTAYNMRIMGYIYYHVAYPRQFLSGGLRFRCCDSPYSFEGGKDLPDCAGLPWEISLPVIFGTSRHAVVLLRQFITDGVLTDEQITVGRRLLGGNFTKAQKGPPTLIHEIGQPFAMNISAETRVCVLGPHATLRAYIYPRVAESGSAVVSLEKTANDGELRMRIVRVLSECKYLPEHQHMPPLAPGSLLPAPHRPVPWSWTYDERSPVNSAALHCLLHPTHHFLPPGEVVGDEDLN